MDNLSALVSAERAEAARRPLSESALKAAIRVVEETSKYLETAEKTMAAGKRSTLKQWVRGESSEPVSREEYDRAKASYDDAMKTIARGLAESGDTAGATQVLRRLGRLAMPSD
jgi:hypothetical protein